MAFGRGTQYSGATPLDFAPCTTLAARLQAAHRTPMKPLSPRLAALVLAATFALPAWAQKVKLSTSAGDIVIELDAAKAPKSVENFVAYVKAGQSVPLS